MFKPGMKSVISSPTSMYAMAFLKAVWNERKQLADYERKGFAQFFYQAVCSHLEYVLSQHIGGRVFSLRFHFDWNKMARDDGGDKSQGNAPLAKSMIAILDWLDGEVDAAPLQKLIELHNRLFPIRINDCIGHELNKDLRALCDLRNIFAHGRVWCLEFFGDTVPGEGMLDYSPLKGPALRLHAAGVIKSMAFSGKDHHEFTDQFYSDEALLYFLDRGREIEEKLIASSEVPSEQFWAQSNCRLPDLNRGEPDVRYPS